MAWNKLCDHYLLKQSYINAFCRKLLLIMYDYHENSIRMKTAVRILCLEDDEDDFDSINYVLENAGMAAVTLRVDSREKYINTLRAFKPDVILSDHSLPSFNSIEALDLCKTEGINIPFILVTGAVSDEFAATCIKLGANDYLLKSNLKRLPSAIANALKLKETEKARAKAMSDLAMQNDDLIKINKEVDSLVYSVSHNLRAPLMSLVGLLQLSRIEQDIGVIRDYNRMMEATILKLDETLKEILAYSRNARQDLQLEEVDFKKLIDDGLDKMRFMPEFASLDVQVSVDAPVPFRSDPYRLSITINNLISNAIKYLDHRKERSMFCIKVTANEEKAIFRFEDNGIGIERSLIPRIFDMFFRGTTSKDGSGLGLYIVREAVEKLGGTIEVASELKKGTVFTLQVPNHAAIIVDS